MDRFRTSLFSSFSKMISQKTVLGPLPNPPGSQNGSQNLIITARGLPLWYQIPADFRIFLMDRSRTLLFTSFSKMMSQKGTKVRVVRYMTRGTKVEVHEIWDERMCAQRGRSVRYYMTNATQRLSHFCYLFRIVVSCFPPSILAMIPPSTWLHFPILFSSLGAESNLDDRIERAYI